MLANSALANDFYQLLVGAGEESNVPRGQDRVHEISSAFVNAEFIGGRLFQLDSRQSILVSGSIAAVRYDQLDGFDAVSIGAAASYEYQYGLGAYAPVLAAGISVRQEFLQGDARDNWLTVVDLSYQKRLSPSWFLSLAADFQFSDSDSLPHDEQLTALGYGPGNALPYEIYDYESQGLSAALDYTFANGVMVSGGYRFVNGHTVSSTTMITDSLYKESDAVYVDPAFSHHWFAYQLEADVDEYSVGLSVPVGVDAAIDATYRWIDIDSIHDNDYKNSIFSIGYVHSF